MKLVVLPCVAISVVLTGCGGDGGGSTAASTPVGGPPVEAVNTMSGDATEVSLATGDTALAERTTSSASSESTFAPAYYDVVVGPGLGGDGFVGAGEDVELQQCELDGDHWAATGIVTNSSGAGAAYRIYVAFNPPDSTAARGLVQVDLLVPDGESQAWKAIAWITDPGLECVVQVERVAG